MEVKVQKSTNSRKKYMVVIGDKTVHFGAEDYQDFTTHNDPTRQTAYLKRHKVNENWTLSGVKTAGFWARWLLWNKSSLTASVRDVNSRFKSLKVST